MKKTILTMVLSMLTVCVMAEDEMFKFGGFDTWITRNIRESVLVGGKHRTLYEVDPLAPSTASVLSPIRVVALVPTATYMPRWQEW